MPLELAAVGQDVCRADGEVQGQLRRQVGVCQARPVGAESPSWPGARVRCRTRSRRRGRTVIDGASGSDQRLLNCEALRAFLSPAFLRSTTRASRVSRPAFLSAGRLASVSMPLSERATPRRRAPA